VTTLLFEKEILRLDEVIVALLMNETWWGNNGLSNDGQVAIVIKRVY